jgi:hypothetical protein
MGGVLLIFHFVDLSITLPPASSLQQEHKANNQGNTDSAHYQREYYETYDSKAADRIRTHVNQT